MERAGVTPLSSGAPAQGAPPTPMEQPLSKRPRPPIEAEQVRATPVAPHGPWPRPNHSWQPCLPPSWGAAGCWHHPISIKLKQPLLHWACLYGRGPSRLGKGRAASAARPETGWPSWAQLQHHKTSNTPQNLNLSHNKNHTNSNRTHLLPSQQAKDASPSTYETDADPLHGSTTLHGAWLTGSRLRRRQQHWRLRRHLRPLTPSIGRHNTQRHGGIRRHG